MKKTILLIVMIMAATECRPQLWGEESIMSQLYVSHSFLVRGCFDRRKVITEVSGELLNKGFSKFPRQDTNGMTGYKFLEKEYREFFCVIISGYKTLGWLSDTQTVSILIFYERPGYNVVNDKEILFGAYQLYIYCKDLIIRKLIKYRKKKA